MFEELWQRAKGLEFGLIVGTLNDHERIRVGLYQTRKELNDPELEQFELMIKPAAVWIIRKTVSVYGAA